MKSGSSALMVLPTGELVVHRRGLKAPSNPNRLGFFGGLADEGEKPEETLVREISEETSINVEDLNYKHLFNLHVKKSPPEGPVDMVIDVFEVKIPNPNFSVYEGQGSEVYSLKELLKRQDVDYYIKQVLKKLADSGYGS